MLRNQLLTLDQSKENRKEEASEPRQESEGSII